MINWTDWLLWGIYLSVIAIIIWFLRLKQAKEIQKYYWYGFGAKVLGSLAFALVYVFYYKFGDSFEYYKGAASLSAAMVESPSTYLDLLLSEPSSVFHGKMGDYANSLAYSDTPEEWFMVKLLSPLSLLSFNSYLVLNLFMGLISFIGSWKLLQVFIDILPERKNIAFICSFLIPSVVFWGSGIMKDTLTLTGVHFLLNILYFGIVKGQFRWHDSITFLIWFLITFQLKSYIIMALLPGILLTTYYCYRSRIKSDLIRMISGPLLLMLLIGASFFGLSYLSESSEKYKLSQLEWKVKGFHSWHTDVGGSSYNLGEVDYTAQGVLMKVPASLNVTFFRPYIWEARNPVVLLGALESLALFILFLIVLYLGRFKLMKALKNQFLLKGMLIFILVFGVAIGFTSYNFGALGRYKIPILPLFSFTLCYLWFHLKKLSNPNSKSLL
ncbi:MAG: hypothetical protein AB8B72_13070 [Crocinitomicaceae bacterium]